MVGEPLESESQTNLDEENRDVLGGHGTFDSRALEYHTFSLNPAFNKDNGALIAGAYDSYLTHGVLGHGTSTGKEGEDDEGSY